MAGESPGVWAGRGSGDLGLGGPRGGPDLAGVLAGTDPVGRSAALRLARGPASGVRFRPDVRRPKSVSVLHLLAPRELGAATGAAHGAAVADALGYLEGAGLGVRRAGGAPCGTWPRPVRWPRVSSTGPAGPWIPTSTPTWWWPTWPGPRRPVVGARQPPAVPPPPGRPVRLRRLAPPPPGSGGRGGVAARARTGRVGGGRRRPRAVPAVLPTGGLHRRVGAPHLGRAGLAGRAADGVPRRPARQGPAGHGGRAARRVAPPGVLAGPRPARPGPGGRPPDARGPRAQPVDAARWPTAWRGWPTTRATGDGPGSGRGGGRRRDRTGWTAPGSCRAAAALGGRRSGDARGGGPGWTPDAAGRGHRGRPRPSPWPGPSGRRRPPGGPPRRSTTGAPGAALAADDGFGRPAAGVARER